MRNLKRQYSLFLIVFPVLFIPVLFPESIVYLIILQVYHFIFGASLTVPSCPEPVFFERHHQYLYRLPAEEIFWRGYVQNALSKRWSPNVGFIVTTLVYALVHIWSFNFMLVMAALVVGAIWGLAYRLYPQKLGALIVSHAVWDVAVFVVFPI